MLVQRVPVFSWRLQKTSTLVVLVDVAAEVLAGFLVGDGTESFEDLAWKQIG